MNRGPRALLRRLVAGVGVAAALLVTTGAPALAAGDATVAHIESTDTGLEISVDVPADVTPDLAGVTVTLDGETYPATAARLADGDSRVQRTAILAIDTSDSMSGARFEAAQAAAGSFLDAVPDDVLVGVVSFDNSVDVDLSPTTDRDAARSVVAGLELGRGTHLYDAVLAAADLAGAAGQGSVLVLSDGADTGSTPLSDVTSRLDGSDVVVDVVALEQSSQARKKLRKLTSGTGQVISADSDALAATFSAEADVLARQVGVSVTAPADVVAAQAQIEVSLPSTDGDLVARTTYFPDSSIPAGGADASLTIRTEPSRDLGFSPPGWFMYAGVGVFAIGLVLALVMLVPARKVEMSAEERVETYTSGLVGTGTASASTKGGSEATLQQASAAIADLLQRNQSLDARIVRRLDAAGSELKSSEWLLVHGAAFVVITVIGLLLGQGNLPVGIMFMVVGVVGPWLYLGFRGSRRRKKFDSLLPETLQLMSGSLSAGLSLMQSVDTIVREGTDPVASEFRRVLVETRLGVSLEEALDGVADRFDSRDFRWVVMAIRIQRQVGGNLAELLNTVAETMREREYIRRQVAALSAEGQISAVVLGGLPPVFLLYLLLAQPDYVAPLFADIRGIIMLVAGGLWLAVGVFWMNRLTKIEV